MANHKISIALATYNGERYLNQQLLSYTSQNRIPDQLVVCDDCSTDDTINILNKYASDAPFPVHIIRNIANQGTGQSFSRALELCDGNIIAFSDQDDVWLPNKLEAIEQAFIAIPSISYVISNATIVDDQLNSLGNTLWNQRKFTKYWQDRFEKGHELEVFLRLTVTTGMTTAIRSHLRCFGPPTPNNINHDAWYIPLAAIYNHHGALIKIPLVKYRQHSSQQYGANNENKYERIKRAFKNNSNSIIRDINIIDALAHYIQESQSKPNSNSISLINDKLTHLNNRKVINNNNFIASWVKISQEVKLKRYIKYGSWKNIITDIFS